MSTQKLQTILDQIHQTLASDESVGRLTPYFRETFNIDHSAARKQTESEIMIVEDIALDPLHLDTWISTIDGLMFSSPIRNDEQVEYYLLAQMKKMVQLTLNAPAAAAMFIPKNNKKKDISKTAIEIINEQLNQPSNSQSGYLFINPLFFWKIVEDILPDTIEPSSTNKTFIDFVEKLLNELMLHEVNHQINGHTIMSNENYSPLKHELISKYESHKFALGLFEASSPHALANIIEDFAINEYLKNSMKWPISNLPSLFEVGVSTLNPYINVSEHALNKQPSTTSDILSDIDSSVYERIQSFTDSDYGIRSDNIKNPDNIPISDQNKDISTLKEIIDLLVSAVDNNGSGDAHAAGSDASDIDKEMASAQLSGSLKDAEESTGSKPGMQGEDYNRAINPSEKAKPLPKLAVKLAKIRRILSNNNHVNWTMPHQVLTNRLDLHRIEKDTQRQPIDVWLDTSGSMSEDQLNRLMTLIIANYVVSTNKTPIILHTVSFEEVGDPIQITNRNDLSKLKSIGLASNGGTSFDSVLNNLQAGRHIIMSDFEWFDNDVSNNIDVLTRPDKSILWINTDKSFGFNNQTIDKIKKLPTTYLKLSDYEY